MSEIIELIIKWAVPFICGGCVTWAVTYIKLRKSRDTAIEDGLQCLLRAEIIRNHDKYMERGYCPIYAREALKRAYTAYHNLRGNDVATGLYKEVLALPTDEYKEW